MLTLGCCLGMASLWAEKDLAAIANQIVGEGKTLYRTDMASWNGTDILMARYALLKERVGGYFSYLKGDESICVFYNKEEPSLVLLTITFDSTQNVAGAIADTTARPFSSLELDLYTMGKKAREVMTDDTLFKFYKGASPNIIPILYKGEKKVYIVSGATKSGVVLLGNDYLLTFGKNNELLSRKKIHRNLIPIESREGDTASVSMHSHVAETDMFITPTDICTIMEYQKAEHWSQHYVISPEYVSIWTCRKNHLLILTRKAWDRINKATDQRKEK